MTAGAITDGWTAEQIRSAERPLLDAGVPLMRRAAAGLARELRAMAARRILLLAGSGDNGGDGLFAVAELAAEGAEVRIVATGSHLHGAGRAAALEAGARLDEAPPAELGATLRDDEVVVDAMVGTGSTGTGLRGASLEVVRGLLAVPALHRVVAVDVPSGIGVDDGSLPDDEAVLPADVTVTFGGVKVGLLLAPASSRCGEIRLVDIGLGPRLARLTPVLRA